MGHRSLRAQEILRDRPHYAKEYKYKQFLDKVVPKIQAIEDKSVGFEFYYVFVDEDRRDFFDLWDRSNLLLARLAAYAEQADIPFRNLFTRVHVFTHSSDAHRDLLDRLVREGYTDVAADMSNLHVSLKKGEQARGVPYRLGLLNTLSDPQRHAELLRPRETALRTVASSRNKTAKGKAATARSARNAIRNTVRNTPRLPQNVIRYGIAPFLTGKTPRPQTSRTANVAPMELDKLFRE